MRNSGWRPPKEATAILVFKFGNVRGYSFLKNPNVKKLNNRTRQYTKNGGLPIVVMGGEMLVRDITGNERSLDECLDGIYSSDIFEKDSGSSRPPEAHYLIYWYYDEKLQTSYTWEEPHVISEKEIVFTDLDGCTRNLQSEYGLIAMYEGIVSNFNYNLDSLKQESRKGLSPHEE